MKTGMTLEDLKTNYDKQLAPIIGKQLLTYEQKYQGFNAKFSMISAERSVSGLKQFIELFKRNMTYLFRNPAIIRMTFFNTIFVALLVLALFWRVCDVDLANDGATLVLTRRSMFNWIGLSFMLTNNIMMPSV